MPGCIVLSEVTYKDIFLTNSKTLEYKVKQYNSLKYNKQYKMSFGAISIQVKHLLISTVAEFGVSLRIY